MDQWVRQMLHEVFFVLWVFFAWGLINICRIHFNLFLQWHSIRKWTQVPIMCVQHSTKCATVTIPPHIVQLFPVKLSNRIASWPQTDILNRLKTTLIPAIYRTCWNLFVFTVYSVVCEINLFNSSMCCYTLNTIWFRVCENGTNVLGILGKIGEI